jgi:hypothetical protein
VNRALVLLLVAGCGTTQGRLRYVSSQATQASWSFVVEDRARLAEILIDGRSRESGCDRVGVQVRCELRGLYPGGHTVELRLPGAWMKRSVVVGHAWPERPVLVRASGLAAVLDAAKAGADGVILDAAEPADLVDAAHAHGVRAFVAGDALLVETASADGVVGGALAETIVRRFPEARVLTVGDGGLVEGRGLVGGALALTAPHGAIVEPAAFPLLDGRRRHAAMRDGKLTVDRVDGRSDGRVRASFTAGGDAVTLYINDAAEPWQVAAPPGAIDLLGTATTDGALTLRARDVALLVPIPERDKTRY